jgi:hypothetical protein
MVLASYQIRRQLAVKDAQALQKVGTIPSEVSYKLSTIVDIAEEAFEAINPSKKPLEESFVDVKGKFRVSGLDWREVSLTAESCPLCNHTVTGGITYRIQNLKTQKEIKCAGMTLHLLKSHDYFVNPESTYRLDPLQACQVLDIGHVNKT